MSDDSMNSAITHGVALVTGGGVSGAIVRILAGGFLKRLDDIEKTQKELVAKVDDRHEKLIVEMAQVRAMAEAAHRRLDENNGRRRK